MRRNLGFAAVVVFALSLAGCLTSEAPLLNDQNAKATPLTAGDYESCQVERDAAPDCRTVKVSLEGVLYTFETAGEDPSLGRFRPIGRNTFLAQFWEESDSSYFYFYGVKTPDGAKLSMVSCGDVPQRTRDRLVKSKDLAVSSDAVTCTAKTLKGAERATRDYGRRLKDDSQWMILKRKIGA
ncbi:MAG: hypothetical protein K2Q06_03000 [Parvularculaceae bacterium]|nr:hypothetical protein [Parvularculaceae bacterium]